MLNEITRRLASNVAVAVAAAATRSRRRSNLGLNLRRQLEDANANDFARAGREQVRVAGQSARSHANDEAVMREFELLPLQFEIS